MVWVDNPDYKHDRCVTCGQMRYEHFEILTPKGLGYLCETPQQFTDESVGHWEHEVVSKKPRRKRKMEEDR